MKITGYRTLTEKERDYLTLHRLLRRYGVPITELGMVATDLLDELRGNLSPAITRDTSLLQFRIVETSASSYRIRFNQLPEGTTELLIETKCTTKC